MNYNNMNKSELIQKIKKLEIMLAGYQNQSNFLNQQSTIPYVSLNKMDFWKSVLDATPLIVFINNNTRTIWINNYVLKQSGYTRDEWLNFTQDEHLDRFHPDDLYKIQLASLELTKKGEFYEHGIEYRVRHKNGSWFWVYGTFSYIYDEEAEEYRVLGTALDITARKNSEEKINTLLNILEEKNQVIVDKSRLIEKELEEQKSNLVKLSLILQNKNKAFSEILDKVKAIDSLDLQDSIKTEIEQIIRFINSKIETVGVWEVFETQFNSIYPYFYKLLLGVCPNLTMAELKVCMLLKLDLSTKNIGDLLHISSRTVESHRLAIRKKLKIDDSKQISVFLHSLSQ